MNKFCPWLNVDWDVTKLAPCWYLNSDHPRLAALALLWMMMLHTDGVGSCIGWHWLCACSHKRVVLKWFNSMRSAKHLVFDDIVNWWRRNKILLAAWLATSYDPTIGCQQCVASHLSSQARHHQPAAVAIGTKGTGIHDSGGAAPYCKRGVDRWIHTQTTFRFLAKAAPGLTAPSQLFRCTWVCMLLPRHQSI